MTVDRLVFGMHHLNITQTGSKYDGGKHMSHPSYELDLAGEDTGVDFWRNMMSNTWWKIVNRFGNKSTGNTFLFHPIDPATGAKKKVMCADGVERYVTLAMTHSNANYTVGHVYKYKEVMYQEGTAGHATGCHIHLEVADGLLYTKKQINGAYNVEKMMDARKAFFVLKGFTTVVSTCGLAFRECDEVPVKEETKVVSKHRTSNDLEQVNYLGTSKSTRKIATSFHVYRKLGSKPKMSLKKFKYQGSDITAVQIVMDKSADLGLSYVGYRDWLCSLHNDWMLNNGYEEIAAINGGFFIDKVGNYFDGQPIGAVLKDWSGAWAQFKGIDCVPSRDNGYPTLSWNGTKMELHNVYANELNLNAYAWLCGVGQSLVLNGKVDNSTGTQNGRYNSKVCASAIGFNHSTNTLTFAINSKVGLNTLQRSYMMQSLGCDIAVQLDGGGSSQIEWLAKALS